VIAAIIVAVVLAALALIALSYVLQARRRRRWQADATRGVPPHLAGAPGVSAPVDPAGLAEGELRAAARTIGPLR
jgi:hypothetical protein